MKELTGRVADDVFDLAQTIEESVHQLESGSGILRRAESPLDHSLQVPGEDVTLLVDNQRLVNGSNAFERREPVLEAGSHQ